MAFLRRFTALAGTALVVHWRPRWAGGASCGFAHLARPHFGAAQARAQAAGKVPRAAKAKGFGKRPTKTAPPKLITPKGCRSVMVTGTDGGSWQVLIGKSAAENDRLSLEHGQKHEVWMHAASVPGSHVVVRATESWQEASQPPRDVVQTAAELCAFYSKAKSSPQVEVHITTCGQVSKLPGAPAGQVLLRGRWRSATGQGACGGAPDAGTHLTELVSDPKDCQASKTPDHPLNDTIRTNTSI
ncbi:unnamed protein product [Durusdinium trenchii]|uniref:NFACT RNA-binding domain-containing protein n=1 Tax=Durusdinium trenchii TaxID=1381693 RepID=A0ABP0MXJ6_9DINO